MWRALRVVSAVAFVAIVLGLMVAPATTLPVFWNVAVPLLPASFLVSPILWRSICPLATANMLGNGIFARRTVSARGIRRAGSVGIALLFLLIPTRRVLLDDGGLALAVLLVILAVAAFAAGAFFDVRAGFCNTICPILPVEKLYGQSPVVQLGNPRCATCSLCVAKGCVDLAPEKALRQSIGPRRSGRTWVASSHGAFALAFPGLIAGFFAVPANASVAATGGTVAIAAGLSYALLAAVSYGFSIESARSLLYSGALAAGLYYWFAATDIAWFYGGGFTTVAAIRITATALILAWLVRASLRQPRRKEVS